MSAPALFEQVGAPRGVVYTTVAKVLERLLEKGLVSRIRDGRTFLYSPTVQRADTYRAMARAFIEQILGDDPAPAAAALAGAVEEVSGELLERLRAELEARKEEEEA